MWAAPEILLLGRGSYSFTRVEDRRKCVPKVVLCRPGPGYEGRGLTGYERLQGHYVLSGCAVPCYRRGCCAELQFARQRHNLASGRRCVVSVGACPFAAGWLSHRLTNVALFPASVLVCLSVSFMILGAPSSDVAPIPFSIALSIIYGGLAAVLSCVGWTARRYNPLARIGRASGKQRHE